MRHWPVLLLSILIVPAPVAHTADLAGVAFFEKKIRPVLVQHCYGCHSVEAKKNRGGLLLDSKEGLLKGGDNGPPVVAGKPEASLLVQHIRWTGVRKMPPKEKLPDTVIADLEKWVALGAPDPRITGKTVVKGIDYETARQHWAYQPVKVVAPPTVRDTNWPRSDFDRHILAAIEAKGLHLASDAPRSSWLRRVSYDLIGLPPSPEELETYLSDQSAEAETKVVDRLLRSKQFGANWGRHWLDGVRFNETIDTVDRYRRWVIRACNDDLPYDQFVIRQLAGDLLCEADPKKVDENLIATQMLVLNQREMDPIEGVVEVIGQQILGVSLNCAKCHNHKFDAFSQQDYYALAGMFTSTTLVSKKSAYLISGGLASGSCSV